MIKYFKLISDPIIILLIVILISSCQKRHYKSQSNNSSEIIQLQNNSGEISKNDNVKSKSITGKVIGISDGDTFSLLFENGFNIKVRLNSIDCPEKKQPFSNKAKQELSNMIFNKQVRVDYKKKDGYGRVLGDVYIDNLFVNEEMVKRGMAWHYKKYSDDENLANLEIQARNKKIGLWQDSSAIPPWEFRKK